MFSRLAAKTASADKMIESLKRDASKLVEERASLELDMMRQLAQLDEAKHRVDGLTNELDKTKKRLKSVEEEKLRVMGEESSDCLSSSSRRALKRTAQITPPPGKDTTKVYLFAGLHFNPYLPLIG